MGRQIGGFPKITTFLGELRNSSNHFFLKYVRFSLILSYLFGANVMWYHHFFLPPPKTNSWPQLKVDPFLFWARFAYFQEQSVGFWGPVITRTQIYGETAGDPHLQHWFVQDYNVRWWHQSLPLLSWFSDGNAIRIFEAPKSCKDSNKCGMLKK